MHVGQSQHRPNSWEPRYLYSHRSDGTRSGGTAAPPSRSGHPGNSLTVPRGATPIMQSVPGWPHASRYARTKTDRCERFCRMFRSLPAPLSCQWDPALCGRRRTMGFFRCVRRRKRACRRRRCKGRIFRYVRRRRDVCFLLAPSVLISLSARTCNRRYLRLVVMSGKIYTAKLPVSVREKKNLNKQRILGD